MNYKKINKKSSEIYLQAIEEKHEIVSDDHKLNAENPETLWILVRDGMTDEADIGSLDENSKMLLQDVEINNVRLKEFEYRAETRLNENGKFIASVKSINPDCKEFHDKLSCLTTERQEFLKRQDRYSEPIKSKGDDVEVLKLDLETLKSMLKEKDELILELRTQLGRLTHRSQEMEDLETIPCGRKQTIENFKFDVFNKSSDAQILLIKNGEIQNQTTEELTRSDIKVERSRKFMKLSEKKSLDKDRKIESLSEILEEEEMQLITTKEEMEKLRKSREKSLADYRIKEVKVKLFRLSETNVENESILGAKVLKKNNTLNTDEQNSKSGRTHGRGKSPPRVVSTTDPRLRSSKKRKKY